MPLPKSGSAVGTVHFRTEEGTKVDALITEIAVEPADSGSGVFNPDGRLVAVAFAAGGPVDGPRHEHCVPLAAIKRFLGQHR